MNHSRLETYVTLAPSEDERFRAIYDSTHAAIRSYCLRRLPPADANEAMAEVFLVAWRKIDMVPHGDAALRYLYGIARNTVSNVRRSQRRRNRLDAKVVNLTDAVAAGHESMVIQRDATRRVIAALETMKPDDQEILRLKAWEELPDAEIAILMGLSVRAVESRLFRARKELSRRTAAHTNNEERAVPRSINEGGEQ